MTDLTHIDEHGKARMVDVFAKVVTWRLAEARRKPAMTLTVDIPESVEADKRIRLAVALYDARLVSQGRAAELARLTRTEFLEALGRAGVSPFQYTAEEAFAEARPQ